MSWQNYPLFRLIIPFTLGMIGANLFIGHMNLVVLFILCCAVLAFLFFFLKTPQDNYRNNAFGIVAMGLFFLIGMTLHTLKHQSIERSIPQDTTYIQGILTEQPTKKAHSWALHLKEGDAHIILYVKEDPLSKGSLGLSIGDTILASPTHFNPTNICENDTFKTFYDYLFHNGICATAYAPRGKWRMKPCQQKASFLTSLHALQGTLHTIYDEHGINGDAGSIIEAMTIGKKDTINKETRTAYAHAGVSHVLALSGFHVGIIVLMLQFFLFKNYLLLRWQWVCHVLIILALWGYALITGMSPSLVRATLMFTILLLCQSFSRTSLSINSCALTFFIMLCINPFYLQHVGFQLSFISVTSISLFVPKLQSFQMSLGLKRILQLIAITFICTLFTAPLVAHDFGCIPFLSILSNLLLIGFVYLLMWTSILWWAFLWCDPINALLTDLLNGTASTMNTITESISSLPFATIDWQPDVLTTCFCYVALLILSYRIAK